MDEVDQMLRQFKGIKKLAEVRDDEQPTEQTEPTATPDDQPQAQGQAQVNSGGEDSG